MGSGLMGDLKRQASLFLKDKMKRARLVLMDATPAQLLTEEITNGDSCAQDASAMRMIARAAFEVDDYERIVHILHHRLSKFDTWNWRGSYNALVVLEYLLTHGPLRVAEEFQSDQQTITHMAATFHYVDHKGFDWGLSVKDKSERITSLLQDKSHLTEERAKARKLSVGIKGFGSFNISSTKHLSTSDNRRQKDIEFDGYKAELVSNGCHEYVMEDQEHPFWDHKESHSTRVTQYLSTSDNRRQMDIEFDGYKAELVSNGCHEYVMEDQEHPFWDHKESHSTRVSLLSAI